MPSGLSDDEQAAWTQLVAEMSTVPGLLQRADRGCLELVARLQPAMRAAAVVVREQGSTVECFDKHGHLKFCQQRPEAGFYLKTAATLKALLAELGLTPSGRSRVSLSPAPAASKLDVFLKDRHAT
jgi:P27 family predicted phage terminase small subunit